MVTYRYQYDPSAPTAASQLRLTSTRELNLNVSVSNANMIIQAYASWNSLIHVNEYHRKRVNFFWFHHYMKFILYVFSPFCNCRLLLTVLHFPLVLTWHCIGSILSNRWWSIYYWRPSQEKLLYNSTKQTWSGYLYSSYWIKGTRKHN